MTFGSDSPLLLLWWLKMKGRVRLLTRRARTPGGAVSLFVGVALLLLWVGSIILRSSYVERTTDPPEVHLVRLGLAAYLAFVAFSSLSFRGVYMPRPELERLFSGPIKRSSIVRFRMLGAMLMALPFTVIVALFAGPRFASPWPAAFGLALTIPTASIFGQGLSLLAAKTGGLGERLLGRIPQTLFRMVGALGIIGLFVFLSFGPGIENSSDAEFWRAQQERVQRERTQNDYVPFGARVPSSEEMQSPSVFQRLNDVAASPVVRTLTLPLHPWAKAIASPTLSQALPWLALIGGLLAMLFELVARLPIDFRETSLRTSKDMESKLARLRGGQGGAGAFGLSRNARGWRIPWLAGRSPMGAVVWVRTAWLIRQARGTLFIVAAVAVIGIVVGVKVFYAPVSGPATLGLLATVYLASGVRADFRTDLDRMESMRAWPIPPWKVFVATLLPGVSLTVMVVTVMLLIRAVVLGQFGPDLWAVIALAPFLAYVWTAVDNAVFLLFPVRFIPGQGSALQHTGRGFLLVMLRMMLLIGALALALGGAYFLYEFVADHGFGRPTLALYLAGAWVLVVGCSLLTLLTAFGAWALARFDVTRVPAHGT